MIVLAEQAGGGGRAEGDDALAHRWEGVAFSTRNAELVGEGVNKEDKLELSYNIFVCGPRGVLSGA